MGELGPYVRRRLLLALPLLIGATLIAFLLGVAAPGDPAREALSQSGVTEPTIEEVAAMRSQLGLDRPLAVQYLSWLGRALTGDLGRSYVTRRPIAEELLRRFPITLNLALGAVVLASVLGIGGGLMMGYFQARWIDHVGRALAMLLLSVPGFWLAILLIMVFAEWAQVLPTSGLGGWRHMVLPVAILATGTGAILMRLSRAVMLEVMSQPYILTARAKGLPEPLVVFGHALRNMLIPLVTVIGTYFGGILGGAVVVEVIFAIPGIGRYAIEGILQRDYPIIQGYVLLTSLTFVVFNLVTDLLYVVIHPALRLGARAS